MKVTLDLPDDLAEDLRQFQAHSAAIVAAGLREMKAPSPTRFHSFFQVLEKLAQFPSPQEVLDLHPSPELDGRIRELLRKNREDGLNEEEEEEWRQYESIEHLVRVAKARARAKLQSAAAKA
jgi:hypothetical protein